MIVYRMAKLKAIKGTKGFNNRGGGRAFPPGLLARHLPNGFRIVVPEAARHALFPLFSSPRISRTPDTAIVSPYFASPSPLPFDPINLSLKFNRRKNSLPLPLFYTSTNFGLAKLNCETEEKRRRRNGIFYFNRCLYLSFSVSLSHSLTNKDKPVQASRLNRRSIFFIYFDSVGQLENGRGILNTMID